ncbi:MAG: polyprenyl synthetase family protein [Candidatus Nezhaarchaeota archaeon]|nr:polyprenyl synthetase family protein [Candidatus Nezhaarchaeota archaeon]
MNQETPPLSKLPYCLNEATCSLLTEFEHRLRNELVKLTPPLFLEPVLYAVSGGKRIRPLILLLSSCLMGKPSLDPFPAAITVELLHCGSLVHDDIIDREKLRRGRDPFHIKFGFEMGVLSADLMLALSSLLVSHYGVSRLVRSMLKELSKSAMEMCEGELLESSFFRSREITWRQYLKIVKLKTAPLFRASAKLGGLIATRGRSTRLVASLAKYGLLVGMAYQVRDDVLDAEQGGNEALRMLGMDKLPVLKELSRLLVAKAKLLLGPFQPSPFKSALLKLADVAIEREL